MPQMAPLSWVSLFIMFSVIFMLFNPLNYYLYLPEPKISHFKKTTSLINWKW
uniref:ATP synthase complex subunit 8 n=1 Tax=Dryops ernesti TaxID=1553287 RepID=A0A343A430_9COLE|nr:ATP synthase F0 subunit 8 [Dryops ernesti]AOY39308.1 ATP synthase F0 subunit 8 [Dryops ernesti]